MHIISFTFEEVVHHQLANVPIVVCQTFEVVASMMFVVVAYLFAVVSGASAHVRFGPAA